jgi:hypothetical protein
MNYAPSVIVYYARHATPTRTVAAGRKQNPRHRRRHELRCNLRTQSFVKPAVFTLVCHSWIDCFISGRTSEDNAVVETVRLPLPELEALRSNDVTSPENDTRQAINQYRSSEPYTVGILVKLPTWRVTARRRTRFILNISELGYFGARIDPFVRTRYDRPPTHKRDDHPPINIASCARLVAVSTRQLIERNFNSLEPRAQSEYIRQ